MYCLKELRLNDFKEVAIPKREKLYRMYAGRAVPDFNRTSTDDSLPDNLIGNKMDDFRNGMRLLAHEEAARKAAADREEFEKLRKKPE